MNKPELINFNEITDDDILRWNMEILEYNNEHNNTSELEKATPNVIRQVTEFGNYLLQTAHLKEKMVTNDLNEVLGDDGYFVELDHRFKERKRLEEKIYHKVIKDNLDIMKAGNSIYDVLRYTIIFDFDTYTTQVDNYLTELEDLGYKVVKFKNRWDDVYYKGINVYLEYNGLKFELQFHTEENYLIKETYSREPYKLTRKTNAPIDLLTKAYYLRKIYQQKVHIPPFALGYEYQSKKNKSL